jgi:hypothetical protein
MHSASERSLLVGLKKDSRFRRVQFVVVNATRDLISIEGSLQPLNKDVVNDIPIRAAFIQTIKKSKDGKSKAVTTMAMRSHRGVFDSSSLTSFLVSCTDEIKDEGKDAFVSIKQAPWLRKRPKPKTSSSSAGKDKSDDTSDKKSNKKKETPSEKKTSDKDKKAEKPEKTSSASSSKKADTTSSKPDATKKSSKPVCYIDLYFWCVVSYDKHMWAFAMYRPLPQVRQMLKQTLNEQRHVPRKKNDCVKNYDEQLLMMFVPTVDHHMTMMTTPIMMMKKVLLI